MRLVFIFFSLLACGVDNTLKELKKSWNVFFYSVLAFILCVYEAGACLYLPDEIKVPGSTFTAEKITVENSKKMEIRFGKTTIYHNGSCWFYVNGSKCLHRWEEERRKNGELTSVQISKNGRTLGLVKYNDQSKTLRVYSIFIRWKAKGY